jgi:hypothetical protein
MPHSPRRRPERAIPALTVPRLLCSLLLAASSASLPCAGFAACDARSGPKVAALVELYTSEGCSSCPPADRLLSRLPHALDPAAEAVSLALHVDYWDYIGWKDPYALAAFGERQGWLVRANRRKTAYTPHFFVNGLEVPAGRDELRDRVRQQNTLAAAAVIRVQASLAQNDTLAIHVAATSRIDAEPVALYVTIAESGLASNVQRGENRGAKLAHDHVARDWFGPVRLQDGEATLRRSVALPASWNRERLQVVAFVQGEHTARVFQALGARGCVAP